MSTAVRRILGQEPAITTLVRSLIGGHVHHAWIFHGPFGVGKFTTALEFARLVLDPAVTAAHVAAFAPPRETKVARLIDASSHPDLHVIRKERSEDSQLASLREKKQTNIPIDLLRELMLGGVVDERTFDGPVWRTAYLGHGKVFIIDEAELLDHVGQNALLKTLEEPPPHTYLILVTTREDRLLPTIRSRCQRVAFGPLDPASMQAWMAGAAEELGAHATAASRGWTERFAEGSPGTVALATRFDVPRWAADLARPLMEMSSGRFVAGLAERMGELVGECAEAIVKGNPKASKEAANRLGSRLLFGVLGQTARDEMGRASRESDVEAAEHWATIVDALVDADEALRRHLNQKQVFANLVAQWTAIAPTGSTVSAKAREFAT